MSRYEIVDYLPEGCAVHGLGRGETEELYSQSDAQALFDWLTERDAGYPSLAKFEGGKNWPEWTPRTPYSDQEGGTRPPYRTPWGVGRYDP